MIIWTVPFALGQTLSSGSWECAMSCLSRLRTDSYSCAAEIGPVKIITKDLAMEGCVHLWPWWRGDIHRDFSIMPVVEVVETIAA
jgi:hypothetical protein